MVSDYILLAFELLTVGSAIVVAIHPNVLHSAVALLFTLLGTAIMFLFASADFIAAAQVVIYVGGIMMLTLFAIMLTRFLYSANLKEMGMRLLVPGIVALGVFSFVYRGVVELGNWIMVHPNAGSEKFSLLPKTAIIGDALLGNHLLAFEAVTILLLGALVGAVWLARPEQ